MWGRGAIALQRGVGLGLTYLVCSLYVSFINQHKESRRPMDFDAIIEINRIALLRVMAVMFDAVGIEEGGSVGVVKQRIRLLVLRMLGPAEAAVRRLIFLKARDLPTPEHVSRPAPDKTIPRGDGRSKRRAFPLFDKRKRQGGGRKERPSGPGPRIFFLDGSDPDYTPEPEKAPVQPDDLVDANSMCQRLNAALDALRDLDKQAKRLKRAEARRKLSPRLAGQGVLRGHLPPCHRMKGRSPGEIAVDEILESLQYFARQWIAIQDSS